MLKTSFNEKWTLMNQADNSVINVTLPHDAMISEDRSENAKCGTNGGFFVCNDYVYTKTFSASELEGKSAVLEFEGVYKDAEVFLNGKKEKEHSYGYTGFYVDLTDKLDHENENEITVKVKNSDQPNSRWYSGTGIYRPVFLWTGNKKHIDLDGIKVRTLSIDPAVIEIRVTTSDRGECKLTVLSSDGETVLDEQITTDGALKIEREITNASLWSEKDPYLYTLNVDFEGDRDSVKFGIRTVSADSKNGLLINGKREILRGACIHHDNGLLGAIAHPFAEERKVRLLKENGYNAIRSSHNPCSKALLDACDKLGMYVVDEMYDCWYIHKTKYDYAGKFEASYKSDLADMVRKDRNHPSVIMYSIGNEVAETAQKRGISLTEEMASYLHAIDDRLVTCGINVFFNYLSSIGFGVYSDKKADAQEKDVKKKKAVGSEFFNDLAGLVGSEVMKTGATLHGSDVKTRDAFSKLDVAGYNYGIKRYLKDVRKYPDRVILGSETFCKDTGKFWNIAKKHPGVIGDFDWVGIDYIGEVGLGAREYKEYAPTFDHTVGWLTAGSGRIDITGKPLGEALYKKTVFDLCDIAIGVIPVGFGKHSPSTWRMTNSLPTWSWRGREGAKTSVEVYAKGEYIDLFLNGELIATKKCSKNYCTTFKNVKYANGTLKAVVHKQGNVTAETTLKTAGTETVLTVDPEDRCIKRDGLAYVRLRLTDGQGEVKPLERDIIRVSVENGELLALGHACPYNADGYQNDHTDTYYGEALAIVKPTGEGDIVVTASCGFGTASTEIEVK